MKKLLLVAAILTLCVAMTVAFAEDAGMLLINLPEDAQMIENVMFEDGDFIQTYQLGDGGQAQIVHSGMLEMSVEALAESEWTGYEDFRVIDMSSNEDVQIASFKYKDGTTEESCIWVALAGKEGDAWVVQIIYPASDVKAEEKALVMLQSIKMNTQDQDANLVVG